MCTDFKNFKTLILILLTVSSSLVWSREFRVDISGANLMLNQDPNTISDVPKFGLKPSYDSLDQMIVVDLRRKDKNGLNTQFVKLAEARQLITLAFNKNGEKPIVVENDIIKNTDDIEAFLREYPNNIRNNIYLELKKEYLSFSQKVSDKVITERCLELKEDGNELEIPTEDPSNPIFINPDQWNCNATKDLITNPYFKRFIKSAQYPDYFERMQQELLAQDKYRKMKGVVEALNRINSNQ